MSDRDALERTLAELSARLDRIERHLELPAFVRATDSKAPSHAHRLAETTPSEKAAESTIAPPVGPRDTSPSPAAPLVTPVVPPPIVPRKLVEASPSTSPHPVIRSVTVQAPPPRLKHAPLELTIGSRWMMWVGAIVVVIGAGFLAKVMDIASLWGALHPALKCFLLGAFGLALLIGGEAVSKRFGRLTGVGLTAAGLGTWYVTAYATFGWYDLLGEPAAFILLGSVAVIGVALSLRSKSLSIAILSIIGGYLAPLLLHGASTFAAAMPLYLTALLGIALALSAFAAKPFRSIRYVAIGGQSVLGALWMVNEAPTAWAYFLVFGGIWWTMVVAESVFAALRNQSRVGNGVAVVHASAAYISATNVLLWTNVAAASFWSGVFTSGIAVLAACIALQFGTGLDSLRRGGKQPIDVLTAVLWVQVGILLPIAAALQFDAFAHTISWLLLGVGAIEAGRRLESRRVDIFGLIVGALAFAKCILWDSWATSSLSTQLLSNEWFEYTPWCTLALVTIAIVLIAGCRLRADGLSFWSVLRSLIILTAVLLWFGLTFAHADTTLSTFAWLIPVGVCILLRHANESLRLFDIGRTALLLAALKWATFDLLAGHAEQDFGAMRMLPFLNASMLAGLLIAAAILWMHRLQRLTTIDQPSPGSTERVLSYPIHMITQWLPVFAAFVLMWGASFEIDRVIERTGSITWDFDQLRVLWISLLWGAGGLSLVVIGRATRQTAMVLSGIAIVSLVSMAWLLVGTIMFRLLRGPSPLPVVFNPQCLIGIAIGGLLLYTAMCDRRGELTSQVSSSIGWPANSPVRFLMITLLACVGLWLGSLEIDRLFAPEHTGNADSAMARQSAWSIYWAMYGIGLIIAGFLKRLPLARYAGIALLAITLAKVAMVDTSQLEGIYRPLSYMVLGLLLVATSIGYTRLAPKLLNQSTGGDGEFSPRKYDMITSIARDADPSSD